MTNHRFDLSGLAASCVLGTLLLAANAKAYDWQLETVDSGKHFMYMTDRSMRLDSDGRPHVAYGGDRLYYAWHDGTAWVCEIPDSTLNVGSHAALGLGTDGFPRTFATINPTVVALDTPEKAQVVGKSSSSIRKETQGNMAPSLWMIQMSHT